MQNPFTLTFGKSPLEPVERPVQTKEIIDTFTAEQINQQMFIITGAHLILLHAVGCPQCRKDCNDD